MIDAELIQQCADPSLKVEIVQKFIEEAGGADHLTVTVRAGERIILVPKPSTEDEALELIEQNLGQSIVRVGVTQYPAGLGIQDISELSPDLLDSCKNIGMGTALFAKVYRIVTKWYGAPAQEALEDAILAYKTGWFEGKQVFYESDPDETELAAPQPAEQEGESVRQGEQVASGVSEPSEQPISEEDPNKAGIRIDLSGISNNSKEQ
ncbi:TraH family protein [Mesorhizobium sp. YIM 152430]|uniref:TraH family protein n=1 Tax=Mesorhizobium sp. YIM 152430 TaxID=3031761 RepID=UPI0023DA4D27|nr:TraH family protein [Mesorhizobium sp. YIM 152430]MDF1600322.1 TraH family protein [Mesorhizobium sp. YIM 152430]